MRTERHDAIARLEIADDRSRFVAEAGEMHGTPSDEVFPSTSHTPGPLPGSKIARSVPAAPVDEPCRRGRGWMEMVEPSGASARRPSSTYRASNVRV